MLPVVWISAAKVIGAGVTKALGAAKLWTVAHAPELLMAGRIAATGAGVYAACKATTRAGAILSEYESEEKKLETQVALIKQKQDLYRTMKEQDPKALATEMAKPAADRLVEPPESYTEREHRKDLIFLKRNLIFKMAKNYALSIGLFGGAILFDILGYRIVSARMTALAVAYTSLDNMFKAYQARVKQVLGEDGEAQLRMGGPAPVAIQSATVDGVEQKTEVVDQEPLDMPFQIVIDDTNPHYDRDRVYFRNWLTGVQKDLSQILGYRTYLTWNDVNLALDDTYIPTKQGEMWGWTTDGLDRQEIINQGDRLFDLGIEEAFKQEALFNDCRFVLRPGSIGYIYDHIPEDEGLSAMDRNRSVFSGIKDKVTAAVGWKKAMA